MPNRFPLILAAAASSEMVGIQAALVITAGEASAEGKPSRPTVKMNAYNGGAIRVAGYYRPVVIDLAGVQELVSQSLSHESRS